MFVCYPNIQLALTPVFASPKKAKTGGCEGREGEYTEGITHVEKMCVREPSQLHSDKQASNRNRRQAGKTLAGNETQTVELPAKVGKQCQNYGEFDPGSG